MDLVAILNIQGVTATGNRLDGRQQSRRWTVDER